MRPAAAAFLLLLTLPAVAADKLSPFTEVVFEDETPFVRFEGKWYELIELDGLKAERIVKFCKATYDRKWDRRFAEDLVEVLEKMGQRPGRHVRLLLAIRCLAQIFGDLYISSTVAYRGHLPVGFADSFPKNRARHSMDD